MPKEYYPGQFEPAMFGKLYLFCDLANVYNLRLADVATREPDLIADMALFRICSEVIYDMKMNDNEDPYNEYYDGSDDE